MTTCPHCHSRYVLVQIVRGERVTVCHDCGKTEPPNVRLVTNTKNTATDSRHGMGEQKPRCNETRMPQAHQRAALERRVKPQERGAIMTEKERIEKMDQREQIKKEIQNLAEQIQAYEIEREYLIDEIDGLEEELEELEEEIFDSE